MKRRIILDPRTEVSLLYDHMDKTFLVMLDRSMWFYPSYEALIANNSEALVSHEPKLKGQEKSFLPPLTFAFGYAQTIFLCTAIEICLLHHYTNSVYIYATYAHGNIDGLSKLNNWVANRRDFQGWHSWKKLDADQRLKLMKEMSFSSLSVANDFFADIYGNNPLRQALTEDRYKVFLNKFQNMQERRNGIIHRGGELKDGSNIEVTKSDIKAIFETAKSFRDNMLRFSEWCRYWWINNFS